MMSGIPPKAMTLRRNQGFVLICVLWVLAILTVISVSMRQRALLDVRAATYSLDHTKAMLLARGAARRGMVEICNRAVVNWYNGEEGGTGLGQAWAHPVDMFAAGIYFAPGDMRNFDEDKCFYVIEDEERRVSINATDEMVLTNVRGLRHSDVRKIIRRRTVGLDDEKKPVRFLTTEELRYMFKDITEEDWFGKDEKPGLRNLLTCWGSGKININTASREILECVPDVSSGTINDILSYRAGFDGLIGTADDQAFADFKELGDKMKVSQSALDSLRRYCTTNSSCFTITGVATLRQGRIRAHCRAVVSGLSVIQWREEPIGS